MWAEGDVGEEGAEEGWAEEDEGGGSWSQRQWVGCMILG